MKKIKVSKLCLVQIAVITAIYTNKYEYTLLPFKFYTKRRRLLLDRETHCYKFLLGKLKLFDCPDYCFEVGDMFVCNVLQHKDYVKEFGVDEKISYNDLYWLQYMCNNLTQKEIDKILEGDEI